MSEVVVVSLKSHQSQLRAKAHDLLRAQGSRQGGDFATQGEIGHMQRTLTGLGVRQTRLLRDNTVVALDGDAVVGVAIFFPSTANVDAFLDDEDRAAATAEMVRAGIAEFTIAPAHRDGDLAGRLLDEVLAEAGRSGYEFVYRLSDADDLLTEADYTAHGFTAQGDAATPPASVWGEKSALVADEEASGKYYIVEL